MTGVPESLVAKASEAYGYGFDLQEDHVDVVTIGAVTVILLESFKARDDDQDRGRNIFAFDSDGALIWRIQNAGFTSLGANGQQVPQGYTGISERDGELFAFQPIGCLCKIDIATGEIVSSEQTR